MRLPLKPPLRKASPTLQAQAVFNVSVFLSESAKKPCRFTEPLSPGQLGRVAWLTRSLLFSEIKQNGCGNTDFGEPVGATDSNGKVVLRFGKILSCFKLNPFEYLNISFDASPEEVKKQYRKLSLLVHPDKCKHPQAKEAFGALAKAQQLLLDEQERDYILSQVNAAKDELRAKRKKRLKKDTASKIKSLVEEGKYEQQYEQSEEFKQELKLKVREILTEQEWRRRKMQMRISEEEGRLKKDEEETKEMWKRKREHEEQWEGTREQRVSSWRDFMKSGKKGKKGEIRPPKLKTEDPNKSYVQRPVKRG
ncbi:hypothetical protein TIFTF001_016084 [Ficus carica]|uniref:J domain-containing protein n=1 Tax=Ficus carica TaxID=3494 RepID=A0AA87ZZQ7_FICCA|nr:hypothetical protein TIFTF001_016084 [Ficus carica]